MFSLAVRFDCIDDAAVREFDKLIDELVPQIVANEPGTLIYATNHVNDAPLARVFFEVYRDDDAFQAHEHAEHVARFHAARAPYMASERVEFLTPGPGKGTGISDE